MDLLRAVREELACPAHRSHEEKSGETADPEKMRALGRAAFCEACARKLASAVLHESMHGPYAPTGHGIGLLVHEKQKQYGDSFGRSGEVMKIIYPNGLRPDQYRDALALVRIVDKMFRIAQRGPDGKDLGDENPYRDIAGYGILGVVAEAGGGESR